MSKQKDNSTYKLKVADRREILKRVADPCVFEAFGGAGKIFEAVYSQIERGVVIESNEAKALRLGRQRPGWRVYQGDSVAAMAGGIAADMPVNILDLDPYGSPWDAVDAFLTSRAINQLWIMANDGLRQKLQLGGGWNVHQLKSVVAKRGNDLHGVYLDVCRDLLEEKAGAIGCKVDRFTGYYCGAGKAMTHWAARLTRPGFG